MPSKFPTIAAAAAEAAREALDKSRDGLARIELPIEIAIDEFISIVDPEDQIRIGLTDPFRSADPARKRLLSGNARQLTQWRNRPIATRRKNPLLILGEAAGREESGLRSFRNVITEGQILSAYSDSGNRWLSDHVEPKAPQRLFTALIVLAKQRKIDTIDLSSFASTVFRQPSKAHTAPQGQLFSLGLIPDSRAMDGASCKPRLDLNYSIVEMLRSSPDTRGEERQLARLDDAAESGNEVAIAARKFRATGNRKYLRGLELDAVRELLFKKPADPKGGSDGPSERPISLFDALDEGLQDPEAALARLGASWELDDESVKETLEIEGHLIGLDMSRRDASFAFPEEADQVLLSRREVGHSREDAREEGPGFLLNAATLADDQLGTTDISEATREFLGAREKLLHLDLWSDHALEILLLKPELYEAADAYLRSWLGLTDLVLSQREPAKCRAVREALALVDLDWEYEAEDRDALKYVAAEMYPIHPFVLSPLLLIARHARSSPNQKNLGQQLRWAFDRAIPAYPAIWCQRTSNLVHGSGSTRPRFAARVAYHRPEVSSTSGVLDLIVSYAGLYPFACSHLSLLFVDPPKGSGVPNALRAALRRSVVDDLSATVLTTAADAVDWVTLGHRTQYLGRQSQVRSWAEQTFIRANVAFFFLPARPGATESHHGRFEPSRGVHNYFTISAREPSLTGQLDVRDEFTPFVALQPRDSNEVVRRMMEIGRGSQDEDSFFEVQPMLTEDEEQEILALAPLCDWVVVAAPGPMGLVPPRRLGGGKLLYLGREDFGPFALFVYCGDLYAVRKRVEAELTEGPVWPVGTNVEEHLRRLALSVPNGVLRIGRSQGAVTVQVGLMAASHFAEHEPDGV